MKLLVDTNVWFALFSSQDTQNEKSRNLIKKATEENMCLVVHDVIITELLTILKNKKIANLDRIARDISIGRMAEIDETEFKVTPNLIDQFLELAFDISIVDTFLLQISKTENYILATFDKTLEKKAQELKISTFNPPT